MSNFTKRLQTVFESNFKAQMIKFIISFHFSINIAENQRTDIILFSITDTKANVLLIFNYILFFLME